MLSVQRRTAPVNYSKCNQTVTVYHQETGAGGAKTFRRTVIFGAFLNFKKNANIDKTGSAEVNSFLLVIPQGADGKIYVAAQAFAELTEEQRTNKFTLSQFDKALLGIGPEIATMTEWATMIPAKKDGLVVIKNIDPKYWCGEICHVEAGG